MNVFSIPPSGGSEGGDRSCTGLAARGDARAARRRLPRRWCRREASQGPARARYAGAFCAKVRVAVCFSDGTVMAQPLLRSRNAVGVLKTPAKFIPVCNSFDDVAPSPKYTAVTRSSLRIFAPHAKP